MTEEQEQTIRDSMRTVFHTMEDIVAADPQDDEMDTFAVMGATMIRFREFCAEYGFNFPYVIKVSKKKFLELHPELESPLPGPINPNN